MTLSQRQNVVFFFVFLFFTFYHALRNVSSYIFLVKFIYLFIFGWIHLQHTHLLVAFLTRTRL